MESVLARIGYNVRIVIVVAELERWFPATADWTGRHAGRTSIRKISPVSSR